MQVQLVNSILGFCIPILLTLGNYTCEVEWAGDPIRVTHSLVVLQPPTIHKPLIGNDNVM